MRPIFFCLARSSAQVHHLFLGWPFNAALQTATMPFLHRQEAALAYAPTSYHDPPALLLGESTYACRMRMLVHRVERQNMRPFYCACSTKRTEVQGIVCQVGPDPRGEREWNVRGTSKIISWKSIGFHSRVFVNCTSDSFPLFLLMGHHAAHASAQNEEIFKSYQTDPSLLPSRSTFYFLLLVLLRNRT